MSSIEASTLVLELVHLVHVQVVGQRVEQAVAHVHVDELAGTLIRAHHCDVVLVVRCERVVGSPVVGCRAAYAPFLQQTNMPRQRLA